jgi:hypothetical protein
MVRPQRDIEENSDYAARTRLAEAAKLKMCHWPAFNKVKTILTALVG